MQHEQVIEVMRRAVRTRICPNCFKRQPFPDGSDCDEPRPNESRNCEPECNIFRNLTALRKLAVQSSRSDRFDYEHEIQNAICQNCTATATSGDYCQDRSTRDCVLARHALQVGEILEEVLTATTHARKKGTPRS